MKTRLTKAYWISFVSLYALFTLLTFIIAYAGLDDGPGHGLAVFYSTAGTITGPLTGAISREFQGCCLLFSLLIMSCCAPVLLFALIIQFIRMPDYKWIRAMRFILWLVGWALWFLGGILSFGHALS